MGAKKNRSFNNPDRKHSFREPNPNSYLIVTEGECTEPNYFKGLKQNILRTCGGRNIDVIAPTIQIKGRGRSTTELIKETEKYLKKAGIEYQNVWLVFDKDEFKDFDEAIEEAEKKGFKVAWSNESFEYWIFLHFKNSTAILSAKDLENKLKDIFKQKKINGGKYDKNISNIYELIEEKGNVDFAIRNAKKGMDFHNAIYNEGKRKPSECNPGTMVYQLVEELRRYIIPKD